MSQYPGNTNSFPPSIPLIDDSSPPTASYVNPALEALADRTATLNATVGNYVDGVNGGFYDPASRIQIMSDRFWLKDRNTGLEMIGCPGTGELGLRNAIFSADPVGGTAQIQASIANGAGYFQSLTWGSVLAAAVSGGSALDSNGNMVVSEIGFSGAAGGPVGRGIAYNQKAVAISSSNMSVSIDNQVWLFNSGSVPANAGLSILALNSGAMGTTQPANGNSMRIVMGVSLPGGWAVFAETGSGQYGTQLTSSGANSGPGWVDLVLTAAGWVCAAWGGSCNPLRFV